jgi:methyl-accepting chemotaxis protein
MKMSIKLKLALMLIGLIAAVVAVIIVVVFSTYSTRLDEQLRLETAAKMDGAAERISAWYRIHAQNIKSIRNEAANRMDSIESLRPSLLAGVKDNPELSTMYYTAIKKISEGGELIEATGWVPPPEFDQYGQGWFVDSLKTADVILTAPYLDTITGLLVVTISARVDDSAGKALGVVGLDVLLGTVQEIASALKITQNGKSYLLEGGGLFITADEEADVLKANYFQDRGHTELLASLKKASFAFTIDKGQGLYTAAYSIQGTGWILASEGPLSDIYGPLYAFLGMLLLVGALALVGGGVAVYLLAAGFTRPILAMNQVAQRLAKGELDIDTKSVISLRGDEIGMLAGSLNSTIEKLRSVVSEVKETSGQVASGSAELADAANQMSKGVEGISASSQQLSQGATEQAASAEEVSASVEQMSANIRQNADNARQTEHIATKASKDALEGASAVRETVDAMRQIAQKIAIIEEIARQTNMLSLNASIEAARAGEHGKGFAVVASEVGKLAERSRSAAGEISALSKQSVDVAERAGIMLDGMVPDIQRTAELVQEISLASREQDSGAQQINKAIAQLDTVIQHNASISEEFSATSEEIAGQSAQVAGTAEELAAQADRLREAVSFFKLQASDGTKSPRERPDGPGNAARARAAEKQEPQNRTASTQAHASTGSIAARATTVKGGVAIKRPSTAIVPKEGLSTISDDDFLEF